MKGVVNSVNSNGYRYNCASNARSVPRRLLDFPAFLSCIALTTTSLASARDAIVPACLDTNWTTSQKDGDRRAADRAFSDVLVQTEKQLGELRVKVPGGTTGPAPSVCLADNSTSGHWALESAIRISKTQYDQTYERAEGDVGAALLVNINLVIHELAHMFLVLLNDASPCETSLVGFPDFVMPKILAEPLMRLERELQPNYAEYNRVLRQPKHAGEASFAEEAFADCFAAASGGIISARLFSRHEEPEERSMIVSSASWLLQTLRTQQDLGLTDSVHGSLQERFSYALYGFAVGQRYFTPDHMTYAVYGRGGGSSSLDRNSASFVYLCLVRAAQAGIEHELGRRSMFPRFDTTRGY